MKCCQSDTIKQLCGWSFHHYILHDVLDDAREYLLERDMSEHHIAVVIVWESSSHDVLNDAWICTTRYEWTSSLTLTFFTFSIMDVWRHVNKMCLKIMKKWPMINLMHISWYMVPMVVIKMFKVRLVIYFFSVRGSFLVYRKV